MEWVETTGRTVDEAKDRALDQLGVDEQDAEFEVLEEPRPGLFGRMRGEARVRARVRPTRPRPKVERRERRKRGTKSGAQRPAGRRDGAGRGRAGTGDAAVALDEGDRPGGDDSSDVPGDAEDGAGPRRRRRGGRGRGGGSGGGRAGGGERPAEEKGDPLTETELADQEAVVGDFLRGLVDAFGLDATLATSVVVDDEAVEAAVEGDELGLLIGPKGLTLQAIQELARSVVQRKMPGERHGRIRIDVAGYRERRREALEKFALQVADQVRATGSPKALEPMSPPDRKTVHDAVNAVDGVHTLSEGEEPRRRVVIMPDATATTSDDPGAEAGAGELDD